jgi:GcrA cell cycle regulator
MKTVTSILTMNKLKGNMCRWPIGDPKDGDFHFCGSSSEMGRSYCPDHMDTAHNTDTRSAKFKKKAA